MSNIIPVLRLTPIGTQPSAVSVFLSVAKCNRVCRAQTCAHTGRAIHFGQRVGQKFEKISNFGPFLDFTSPISQQPLKTKPYKQHTYLFNRPCTPCRNLVKPGTVKKLSNANGRFVSVLLTHLFVISLISKNMGNRCEAFRIHFKWFKTQFLLVLV